MLAAFATAAHFSISSRICLANSPGVLPTPSAPSAASRSFISGVFTALAVSACKRAMIAAGVPVGASSPYHCRDFVVRDAGLRHGRNIRQDADPRQPRHRETSQLAGFDQRLGGEQAGDDERHLPGNDVLDCRPHALVGNMPNVDARHGPQQLHGQVRIGADPRRCVGQRARMLLGVGDQLGQRLGGHRGVQRQHARQRHHERDRREIAQRVVEDLLVGQMIDRERARGHQQRVAVRRRARGRLDADHVAGARPVLDIELLSHHLRELLRQHARRDVGAAARR